MKKVVILGCPRSGTTLLAKLMEDHLQLAAPIEPHFIEYFSSYHYLFPGTLSKTRRKVLLGAIRRFLLIWLPRNNPTQDLETIKPHSLLSSIPEKIDEHKGPNRFEDILIDIMDAYAQSKDKKGWVDKSAYFFPPNIRRYGQLSKDIKFVHIVRDGRDVCSSWRLSWFGPPTVWLAARLWRQQVNQASLWCRSNPERAIEITYEELTESPTKVIAEISRFVQICVDFTPGESNAMARTLSRGGSHKELSGAVLRNSGKWRQHLSSSEIAAINLMAGKTLKLKGYVSTHEDLDQVHPLDKIRGWLSYFHPTVIKRRAKRLIPLYCILIEFILHLRRPQNHE